MASLPSAGFIGALILAMAPGPVAGADAQRVDRWAALAALLCWRRCRLFAGQRPKLLVHGLRVDAAQHDLGYGAVGIHQEGGGQGGYA